MVGACASCSNYNHIPEKGIKLITMGKETPQGKLVTQYCKDYPDMLTRTLAKMIYKEHPELFKHLEDVRSYVRRRRGAEGSSGSTFKELHREQKPLSEWMKHFQLPSDAESRTPFVIPSAIRKTLLISDIHIPYHNTEALLIALKHGLDEGCDSVFINGDLIDFYGISRFVKDPTARSVKYELDLTAEFFDLLREMYPTQEIYYKLGNHEARWELYFKSKAPELFGDEYFTLEERLNLRQWNVRLIGQLDRVKYGKLNILHGHEFGNSFFSPVNPARGLFLRAKSSSIAGHNHQTSEHHENNLNGDSIACWSTGCLCELEPGYRPFAYTKWNLGFAVLSKNAKGEFSVDNHRIINGEIY